MIRIYCPKVIQKA